MGVLTITLVLDKTKGNGVLLTVQNDDDKITQTILLDGTQIVTTVKGNDDTSTITQKQDSIAIKCKTYTVDAETITQKSTKASDYEAQDTMTVKGTKAVTVQSTSDAVTVEASQKVGILSDGANVEVSAAAGDHKISAMNVKAQAAQNVNVQGTAGVSISSPATSELKGLEVNVTGDVQIKLAGPISQVGGSGMTQIQGGMIQIG
jgi:hypothetical protein